MTDLAWIALGAALLLVAWCVLAVVLRSAAGLLPEQVVRLLY